MDLSPLSSGGNIAGQLSSSTNYTIDGMTAKGTVASGTTSGAYTISMEAVREFEVVTNQYDVTNGRSGGRHRERCNEIRNQYFHRKCIRVRSCRLVIQLL